MQTAQATDLLVSAIKARLNVLLVGKPGIGKTEIEALAARMAKAQNFVMHPSVGDPIDAKGAPWIFQQGDTVKAQFVPFDDLQRVYDAIEQGIPCALFLDDLGQATTATQASYMSLMDKLRGKCSVIAATNYRTDRAGVSGLLEPVKSRFHTIIEIETDVKAWSAWASENELDPILIAFINDVPDALHEFTASADMVNQPCPRTWYAAHKLLQLGLPKALLQQAINGAVGAGRGSEFFAYRETYLSLVSVDQILLDPVNAAMPSKPSELYIVALGLAYRANVQTFAQIVTYVERMVKAQHAEYAALLIRDCIKRDKALAKTETFIKRIACSELGALIRGE
jgi:DNA replicative helicase MCM subunit Mcm2 (Cdc46/Mcm family)